MSEKTNAIAALPLKNGRPGIVFTFKLLTNLAASMCIFGTRTAGLIQDTDSESTNVIGQQLTNDVRLLRAVKCPKKPTP